MDELIMNKLGSLFSISILGMLLTTSAAAVQYVDDFEYDKPASNSFTNGVFRHNIVPIPPAGSLVWDVTDYGSCPTGTALNLWPAADEITFDLSPGEYVNHVGFNAADWGGDSIAVVVGDQSQQISMSLVGSNWEWFTFDADQLGIGKITLLWLVSYEGGFDNITINVVPEPSTIAFLTMGFLSIMRRRR